MALVTFSSLLGNTEPKGTYVVDTSFVLGAAVGTGKDAEPRYKRANALKRHLSKNGVGLVYTGVIQNEACHRLRDVLFESAINNQPTRLKTVTTTYKNARPHEKLKEVMKAGYVKAFELALGKAGKLLEKELESIFFACTYLPTEKMKPKPNWVEFRNIMSTYGLDSSDAMILNFAISQKTFRGLITMDSDFRFCNDVPDFDLVIPDNMIGLPGSQSL